MSENTFHNAAKHLAILHRWKFSLWIFTLSLKQCLTMLSFKFIQRQANKALFSLVINVRGDRRTLCGAFTSQWIIDSVSRSVCHLQWTRSVPLMCTVPFSRGVRGWPERNIKCPVQSQRLLIVRPNVAHLHMTCSTETPVRGKYMFCQRVSYHELHVSFAVVFSQLHNVWAAAWRPFPPKLPSAGLHTSWGWVTLHIVLLLDGWLHLECVSVYSVWRHSLTHHLSIDCVRLGHNRHKYRKLVW